MMATCSPTRIASSARSPSSVCKRVLLGASSKFQEQARGFLAVAVDELALADRSADQVDDPVLQPLVIHSELVEFGALIVGDALDLVEVDR